MEFYIRDIIAVHMPLNSDSARKMSWDDWGVICDCFELHIEPNTTLDFTNGTLSGNIKLLKVRHTLDEEVLKGLLGGKGINQVNQLRSYDINFGRINEILELLGGCEEAMKTRAARKKIHACGVRLKQILKNNEWNIKSAELADKLGEWIFNYVRDGRLDAFTNFCKLKVMTHKGLPIYTMQEEV
jgi:hypothetical protein